MRSVGGRLNWFLGNRPAAAGRCAEHVRMAVDLPLQGYNDAAAVARKVIADEHMHQGPCPRGAMRYWVGGSDGHGHVGIEHAPLDRPAMVASTDVAGPRTVGIKPLGWFDTHWPRLDYVGWSWWIASINTEETPVGTTPPPYRNIKVETPQKIKLNTWVTIDLGRDDSPIPPVGSDDWWVQVHLSLESATVARNDLRYIKGRWVRELPTGVDDTHGSDTKAISLDLPKDSWQSAWSTDMKGLTGVPVSFAVYIGAMHDGTVVSPMRLYTVDDEET